MATVISSNGTSKQVKNLGWLIRHATEINQIVVTENNNPMIHSGKVFLCANLPGKMFITPFQSKEVCRDWLKKSRSLRGVKVEFCGETFLAGYPEELSKITIN